MTKTRLEAFSDGDPRVVFHRTRTLVHLAGARTPLTGVEISTESPRFVTRPPGGVISPGSRGVDADPGRFPVGILTDEFSHSRASPGPGLAQRSATPRLSAVASGVRDLARLLRKQSSDEARSNGSKTKRTEGVAMIAATAFAAVGLVVVAFLNRIP